MTLVEKINAAVAHIHAQCDLSPVLAITLGSGLAAFAEKAVDIKARLPYADIPYFAPSTVEGHPGELVLGYVGTLPVAVLQGRIHYYEGHTMEQVTFPTRVVTGLGAKGLLITNASGGLDPHMQPGHFMIIKDHINLTGTNPLIGRNDAKLGPRFPDMSAPYDSVWIATLEKIMKAKSLRYSQGIYCGVCGPSYETAAEVRYLRLIGGDAVGMSTVPEAIVARHAGLRLAGLCCITNLATGLSSVTLSHADVKRVAQQLENEFCEVLTAFINEISVGE